MMKTPIFLAQASTEMGSTCLRMVMAAHGKHESPETIRYASGVGRSGVDLDGLGLAAGTFGFDVTRIDVLHLMADDSASTNKYLPAIAEWSGRHAVVLEGRSGDSWNVIDPIVGRRSISLVEAQTGLTGPALSLTPNASFQPTTRPPGILRTLLQRHTASRVGLAFVVLSGLALVVPGILTPGLIRLFVDGYLETGDRDGAIIIIGGLAIALGLSIALTTLQLMGLRRLMTITVTSASARFLWHLLRMPAWFVSQRDPTNLAYRVSLTEAIALVMSGPFASAVLAQLTSLFFLVVMFILSPLLAVVALGGYLLLLVLMFRVVPLRLEVRQRQAREGAVTMTELGICLRVLETLKATGSENVAFDRIYSSLGRRITLGNTRLWGYLGMMPSFMILLIQTMVLGAGALMSIQGSLTLGTFAAFSVLLAGFVAPIAILIPSLDAFFNLRGALEQADDVLEQHVDERLTDPYVDELVARLPVLNSTEVEGNSEHESISNSGGTDSRSASTEEVQGELSSADPNMDEVDALLAVARSGRRQRIGLAIDPWAASLKISDLAFGYTSSQPPLFTNVTITIPAGRVVAVVGKSGSGKTSIGRLIAGLYTPWSGVIAIDEKPFNDHTRDSLAQDIGFVDQESVIFQATIRDNITMFDPGISDRDVIAAAKAAQVHDDIIARPGGYDSLLWEDGRDLSGGQRQRIGIARALVRKPRLLVLDEATSALDARTESAVMSHIRSIGCTTLLVAHRLSTVRDADEIVVLHGGGIHERGRHAELALADGLYRELMDA
ncbi:MAG: ATP-binding cassette domain-containing protein [Actinomycetota bacterium]|nr:ATP-binding cassette domain-containing protein [Actinomycetota bacterium]